MEEGGSRDEEGREGWRVKKGGEREGAGEGWGRRDGGKEGRRMGTRAKPGNQLSYLYPLVKPTLDYASASCDLYTTT